MNSAIAGAVLASVAAGGLAYVFVYPLLSGDARAEKRQKALVESGPERRIDRISAVNRRDQVAQSLKELEARQKARHKVTIEAQDHTGGADLDEAEILHRQRRRRPRPRPRAARHLGQPDRRGGRDLRRRARLSALAPHLSQESPHQALPAGASERHRRDRARHQGRAAARRLHAHDRRRGPGAAARRVPGDHRRADARRYRSATRWRSCSSGCRSPRRTSSAS